MEVGGTGRGSYRIEDLCFGGAEHSGPVSAVYITQRCVSVEVMHCRLINC